MEELEKNETSAHAEENTVSLASAQALADALAKIEVYTPTSWVDNSSPDIDAEHLNKPEQAIKRVTDALNSAVDVIKDLQSQVTKNAGDISTVNNNLSKFQIGGSVNNKNIIIRKNNNDSDFTQLYATEDMLEFGSQVNGVWKSIWKAALKSDLPKYDIKTFTVDVTTQNANSNGKYYTEKKLSTESWYSSAKAIVPLFARKSGGAYLCMAEIEYEALRVQADIAISGVTVGILVVS